MGITRSFMIDEIRKIHAHNTLDLCIQTNILTWYLLDQFNMTISLQKRLEKKFLREEEQLTNKSW